MNSFWMKVKKPTRLYDIIAIIAYVIPCFLLIILFVQNRSLFLDSLNLARNIAESSFFELAHPLKYEQSAPILFLFLTKLLTSIFGISEYTLRVLPLLSGIGSLFLFSQIARNFINRKYVIIGVLWLGTNAMFLRYATEFKQYMIDLFVATLLIWICIEVVYRNRNLAIIGIIGTICIWLSMPSVFILAGIIIYLAVNRSQSWKSIGPIVLLSSWFVLNFIAEYFLILQPAIQSSHMQNFHNHYFIQGEFWKLDSISHDFGLFVSMIRMVAGKSGISIGLSILLIGISVYSFINQKKSKGLILVIPILAVFGASLLGKYSLIERLMLFTMPISILLILVGIQNTLDYVKEKSAWINYSSQLLLLLAVVIGYKNVQGLKYLAQPLEVEDNLTALIFINGDEHRKNPIICSQFAYPAYTYYTHYDQNYLNINIGEAVEARYDTDLVELAKDKSNEEEGGEIWLLLGHLPEIEIDNLYSKLKKEGEIKNSYRTKRSAAILFSTQ